MKKNIRISLAAASCALLNGPSALAENSHDVGDWDVSAAILFYQETDRVTAVEPVIAARKLLDTDEFLTFKLTVDTLTGASANGAVPTDRPQTFSGPSGGGSTSTPANETPLDDTFKDTRFAFNAAWQRPLTEDLTMVLGGNVSSEYDYQSFSVNGSLARDLNRGNTTLSAGLSLGLDSVDPVGGKPVAFSAGGGGGEGDDDFDEDEREFEDGDEREGGSNGGSDTKTLVDLVFGLTQIIDQNSLFQLNYALSQSSGYLTDPYKFITVVNPATGRPVFLDGINGNASLVLYENRPDSRLKHSIYGRYKRFLGGDVLDLSYRYMIDDWGIDSHTVDLRYRWKFADTQYLEPHVRLYRQTAADFYTPFFVDGQQPAEGDESTEASADYRLGEFDGYTVGLEYGQDNPSNSWSVALEYYLQTGDEPAGKFGELSNQELYPDVDAMMLRISFDF